MSWKWIDNLAHRDMGGIIDEETNEIICDFGDSTMYYPTEGRPPEGSHLSLILAAPKLLKACKAAFNDPPPVCLRPEVVELLASAIKDAEE